jgi:hypothetical protein
MNAGGVSIGSVIELRRGTDTETLIPTVTASQKGRDSHPLPSRLLNADLVLANVNVSMGEGPSSVVLEIRRGGERHETQDTLVIEASTKPFIGLVWGGTAVMIAGFILAILKRTKEA